MKSTTLKININKSSACVLQSMRNIIYYIPRVLPVVYEKPHISRISLGRLGLGNLGRTEEKYVHGIHNHSNNNHLYADFCQTLCNFWVYI